MQEPRSRRWEWQKLGLQGCPGAFKRSCSTGPTGRARVQNPQQVPTGARGRALRPPAPVSMFQEAARSGVRILKSPPVSSRAAGRAVCNRSRGTPRPGPRRRASKAGAFPDPPCHRVCRADARGCGAASPEANPVVPEADS